jgi:hypothetical protein
MTSPSGGSSARALANEAMPIRLTPQMKLRLTDRARQMIARSLERFPELRRTMITVGYTRKHLGSATIVYRKGSVSGLVIRLKVRKLTYQTIGHELTHLLQGLSRGIRAKKRPAHEKIPSGEQQCDIWTLARDFLFCDDAPTYIKMPQTLRDDWPEYAARVRALCIAAIEKRRTERFYIRWLEGELRKLERTPARLPAQLPLPFFTEGATQQAGRGSAGSSPRGVVKA